MNAEHISFRYSSDTTDIFSDISLSLAKKDVLLLMGPSGCGKSSLAYCLAGLYPAYAGKMTGEIQIHGKAIHAMNPCERAKQVSILFQNPDNQFCMDTVKHEIFFALENINYTGNIQKRMEELLELVELKEVKDTPVHQLSGGTKQKLALATAMATGAKLLVLDEPLANLDPNSALLVVKMLKKLHQTGLTLLIVDHKPQYWLSFATEILLMDQNGFLEPESVFPDELWKHKEKFISRGIFLDDSWLSDYHPVEVSGDSPTVTKLQNIHIAYGKKTILSRVNLELKQGSITALVGENGVGKTTLLMAMSGSLPMKGTALAEKKTGLVFQNPRFQFLTLCVEDEVLKTLRASHPAEKEEILLSQAQKFLEEFGLLSLKESSPYALSQGQQRRLALLSMLAGNQKLLLIDEPTYAQDEKATRFIIDLIQKRVQDGLTVVISTHDLPLAKTIANEIYLVEGGTVQKLSSKEFKNYQRERSSTE